MRLEHIRSFVAVAEALHFTRAARRLGLSQPTLSTHIRALEQDLGIQLVKRTRRSVALTAAGEVLLARARRLLAELEDIAVASKRAEEDHTSELTVSFAPDVGYGHLPEFIHRFLAKAPGVHVRFRELWSIEQIAAVRSGEVDIGFVHPPLDHRGLNVRFVQRDEFLVALPREHPAAGRARVSLRDLAEERWIRLPSPPSAYRTDRGLDTIRLGGFEPRIVAEVTQLSLLLRLVADGVGIGMVTSGFSPDTGVVFKRLSEQVPDLELEVVWRSGETPSPALRSFLSLLDEWSVRVPGSGSVMSSPAEPASRQKGHGHAGRPSRSAGK